jgi:hypothetical protein
MSPRTRRGLGVWASFLLAAALVPASVLAAPSGRAISQESPGASPAASGAPETPAGSPVTGGTLVFGEWQAASTLQPFFTTKPHGTGLGLAIVAKRVAEIGGELKLVSPANRGRGTRFEMKLWPAVVRRRRSQSEGHESKV